MPKRGPRGESPIEPRDFRSIDEIDRAIVKLQRRISDLEKLDVRKAVLEDSGEADVVRSDIRETIRDIFGPKSPEFHDHRYMEIWAGGMGVNMSEHAIIESREKGKIYVTGILNGLISRLRERREDLTGSGGGRSPKSYLPDLNLHPRIRAVSEDLFIDGYPWEAVFSASKALVNFVKEKSGRHDLDGAPLMRQVFSRNTPTLAFNDLKDQTDLDEQEGMMHLFEGAVLGIRNPGGHSFPEGPEQRAVEYLQLLSLLAYRTEESIRKRLA
jgi:uncharacterized protein (TIGR02391 family)